MEQSTTEQMMQLLKAAREERKAIKRKREADEAESMANQLKMDQIKLEQRLERLMAARDRVEARIKAHPDIMNHWRPV
jgi:hypothetical protein